MISHTAYMDFLQNSANFSKPQSKKIDKHFLPPSLTIHDEGVMLRDDMDWLLILPSTPPGHNRIVRMYVLPMSERYFPMQRKIETLAHFGKLKISGLSFVNPRLPQIPNLQLTRCSILLSGEQSIRRAIAVHGVLRQWLLNRLRRIDSAP